MLPMVSRSDLPSDPIAAPWVRPWQWLQLVREVDDQQGFQAYLAEAERHGAPAAFGITPRPRGTTQLPVPREMIIEEWLNQSILFEVQGRWIRLTSGPGGPCDVPEQPLAFASCSVPPGAGVARETPEGPTVGAIDGNARWTDRLLVGSRLDCADFAKRTGQPFVLLWTRGALQVWDVEVNEVVAAAPARLSQAVRPCPLIRDGVPGQLCRMYGGPWVSASIVAAGKWLRERWVRLQDVGCDTCGDGEVRLGPGKVPPLGGHYDVELTGDGSFADQVRCYGPQPCRYSEIVPARR